MGHNDIISFGFNCLKLYNIKDKQAFIYRMIKEADLDTINIYDSDENDDANDDDVVVVLDSDSADENDSEIASDDATDDERIRDIDDDVIISSDDDDYYDSDDDSIGSGDFVVTQRVKNLPQSVTVDLNVDDDIEQTTSPNEPKNTDATEDEVIKDQKPDEAASSTSTRAVVEENVEKDVTSEVNGTAGGTNSTDGGANAAEGGTSAPETIAHAADGDTDTIEEVTDTKEGPTKPFRSELNVRRGIRLISAQPLRKRRRTITESEYEDSKKQREQKRLARAERLAQIAVDEKEKQTAAATGAPNGSDAESKRPVAVPKVKISQVSRAEMLATDMLADSSK